MKNVFKYKTLWAIGGIIYGLIEYLARGHTHWSMIIVGGLCLISCGLINKKFGWDMPLLLQMLIGCAIITALEFVTGLIVNVWLGWDVWDYADMPCNLWGQICLLFSGFWYLLASVAIVLDDYVRYWMFGEDKPRYTFWRWGRG